MQKVGTVVSVREVDVRHTQKKGERGRVRGRYRQARNQPLFPTFVRNSFTGRRL